MGKFSSLGTFPLTNFGLLLLRAIVSQRQTRLRPAAHGLVNHVSEPRVLSAGLTASHRRGIEGGQHALDTFGRAGSIPSEDHEPPSLARKSKAKPKAATKAGEATWPASKQAWMTASYLATASTCQPSLPARGRRFEPGLAMHARIAGFDGPLQVERPFRHRPGPYLERLYPLQQSWPDRKARYTAVTATSNETPRRRHGDWEKASQGWLRERLILPRPTSVDYEQKDRIVGSGRGGFGGQTGGCPSVTA
ncbi:hypothetical protein KVR01_008573 [Diaporthe batatas]|uniref:uncharacterized protein n=1 Tax=Diaporthe batatas TaxID=748121 RepID=UPI001D0477C5|nr:uncharacterized protein KVR01_008573 [Diaporthe batatas]KAG8161586.1 hypothetical protein KVR01_008573 [Diaporthe batatas]